ncbi:MAG TPA: hypothetical protein VHE32_06930 [Rhodanobacteraceae bacterium]|nr:hypothetical protein [Rhodanobacteraceae bacterium]
MKRGDTLMRLKRFRVDDMKRRMATLDAMKSDLERKLSDLEESVARESSAPTIPTLAVWPSHRSCAPSMCAAKT